MLNDAGREIPESIEGLGPVRPYRISEKKIPVPGVPASGRKERPGFTSSLEKAISDSGLKDNDRISFHHHLRLGDRVVEQVLMVLEQMGYRGLILCLSSVMGSAAVAVMRAVRSGLVRRIETTGLKSPLSDALLAGEIPEPIVFRSHGGRARAIDSGETFINLAFIAASAADREGNLTGSQGPNRFGSLGYAMVDAENAAVVIGITDYISEKPLERVSIPGYQVNDVVTVKSIGDKTGIAGGSIRISRRPVEKLIARRAMEVLIASGSIRPSFSYQAGSGGISLLVSRYLKDHLIETGIRGEFASGGATGDLVEMVKEGLFETLWDVQSFDDTAAASLLENSFHREMSASRYAGPHHPECIAHELDVMILSATEIDRNFHVNSITGTNGRILGALGGAPDTAEGADLTIVVMPSFRGRIPTVNTAVRTVCTPGNTVDVLVTERGIAVNPRRRKLPGLLKDSGLPVLSIDELINKVYALTGEPEFPDEGERIAGVVEYRDGTILDCIRI